MFQFRLMSFGLFLVSIGTVSQTFAYDNKWTCERNGNTRLIHLNSVGTTGCDLIYHKKSAAKEPQRLWWAQSSRAFCAEKAGALRDRLGEAGWRCIGEERVRIATMVSNFLQENVNPDRINFTRLTLNGRLEPQYQVLVKDDVACRIHECNFVSNLFQANGDSLELLLEGRLFFADGWAGSVIDSRPLPDSPPANGGYLDLVSLVVSDDKEKRYVVHQHRDGKYRLAQVLRADDVMFLQLEALDW